MPFSFLLQAYVPGSHKCCMSLWRAWGEERKGGQHRRRKRKERKRRGGRERGVKTQIQGQEVCLNVCNVPLISLISQFLCVHEFAYAVTSVVCVVLGLKDVILASVQKLMKCLKTSQRWERVTVCLLLNQRDFRFDQLRTAVMSVRD